MGFFSQSFLKYCFNSLLKVNCILKFSWIFTSPVIPPLSNCYYFSSLYMMKNSLLSLGCQATLCTFGISNIHNFLWGSIRMQGLGREMVEGEWKAELATVGLKGLIQEFHTSIHPRDFPGVWLRKRQNAKALTWSFGNVVKQERIWWVRWQASSVRIWSIILP